MAFINVGRGLGKNGNPGRPNAKNPYIILFKAEDLKTNPVKNADGVSVSVNIELKVGKEAIVIYATPTTIKLGDKSSGDADKKGFITTLEFEHPGSGIEYAEFINSNVNGNLMAIIMYPDLGFNKLLGWPGNSLQMTHEYKDDEKEDTNMVKFESILPGDKYLHYTGLFPTVQGGTKGLGFEDFSVPHLVTESREFILTESGETITF